MHISWRWSLLALIIMVLDESSTTRRLTRNGSAGCWQESARADEASDGQKLSWLRQRTEFGITSVQLGGDFGRESLQATLSKAFRISAFFVRRQTLYPTELRAHVYELT